VSVGFIVRQSAPQGVAIGMSLACISKERTRPPDLTPPNG
jgi:hypothetical protein